jgi:hypothetical protein
MKYQVKIVEKQNKWGRNGRFATAATSISSSSKVFVTSA